MVIVIFLRHTYLFCADTSGIYYIGRSKSPSLGDEGRQVQNHKRRKGQSADENVPPKRGGEYHENEIPLNSSQSFSLWMFSE